MTIGIGVICSSKPKPHVPRPDSLVMMSDTMGSTETDSTDDLYKMWIDDELRLYAVGAGTLDYGGELFVTVQQLLTETLKTAKRTHGNISSVLNKAVHILKSQHFQWDIVPSLGIHGVGSLVPQEKLVEEWQRYTVDLHMLVATFDNTGQAYLYQIGQFVDAHGALIPKTVFLREFPGHCTIGTGGDNANFWLNYRRQSLGLNVRRSVYHAYEAKRMAAKSPTVNDAIEIVIAMPGQKAYHLTEHAPEIDGCPVSLAELELLYQKHGPQETKSLSLGIVQRELKKKSPG